MEIEAGSADERFKVAVGEDRDVVSSPLERETDPDKRMDISGASKRNEQ